ncbi:hypothetical protein ACW73L_06690 [Methylolobus aquaticus]
MVPEKLYEPIRQDAVLLAEGKENLAAIALLANLKSEPAKAIVQSFGCKF